MRVHRKAHRRGWGRVLGHDMICYINISMNLGLRHDSCYTDSRLLGQDMIWCINICMNFGLWYDSCDAASRELGRRWLLGLRGSCIQTECSWRGLSGCHFG